MPAIDSVPPLSPEAHRRAERDAFLRRHRLACLCSPLELREEHASLECAKCGAPLVRLLAVDA